MSDSIKIPKNLLDGIPKEFQDKMISAYFTGFERGMHQGFRQLNSQINKITSDHNDLLKSLKCNELNHMNSFEEQILFQKGFKSF